MAVVVIIVLKSAEHMSSSWLVIISLFLGFGYFFPGIVKNLYYSYSIHKLLASVLISS